MGLLDGDIAQMVADGLVGAGLALPATLIKVTSGIRNPSAPTSGLQLTTTTYAAQGFVARLEPFLIAGSLIRDVNRVVKLYGATIAGGAVPAPGDSITIEGVTSTIVNDDGGKRAVSRDGARAVYTCQCR